MMRSNTTKWITFLVIWATAEAGLEGRAPLSTSDPNDAIMSRLLTFMDNEVDPCQDFQKYVRGNSEKMYENGKDLLGDIYLFVEEQYISMFETLSAQQSVLDADSVEAKTLSFYRTCRTAPNESLSERHYLELVQPDYPFTKSPRSWPNGLFNWMSTLAQLRRFSFDNLLVKMNVKLNLVDSSKYVITIDKPTFKYSLQRLQKSLRTKQLLIRLGVPSVRAMSLTRSIRSLERRIRKLAPVQGKSYDDLTLRELESQTGLPWLQYLNIVFDRTFPEDFEVQVRNVDYFVKLNNLLKAYDAEVIATYMMAKFVDFLRITMQSKENNGARECSLDVRNYMDFGATFLYDSKYTTQLDAEVQNLFNAVRSVLVDKIDANILKLSPGQAAQFKEIIQGINLNLGNRPRDQNHRAFVTNYYRDLQLANDQDMAAAQLKVLRVRASRSLERLHQPAAKGNAYYFQEDTLIPAAFDPFYVRRENSIVVPTHVLQTAYFLPHGHDVFRMSFLGFNIAQMMLQALLPESLRYSPTSQLLKLRDSEHYVLGLKCLNGTTTNTLDKRLIDMSALKLAYEAYFRMDSKYSQLQPSFTSLSLRQLFFLNYAHNLIESDFDTDWFQFHQLIYKLPAFGQAFNCPQSTGGLNSLIKCDIW
ncbi:uncharacterized protein Dere_GG11194 [Drosophila erecta]|uniref:GG11194 n=1 Tax=Drosophila erecta TaxID=7220 RepID=B3P7E7_DROER|nr:uncharacterized protein Dere_GG11194 [Drosophila erecta]